jgi:hypothetical protein
VRSWALLRGALVGETPRPHSPQVKHLFKTLARTDHYPLTTDHFYQYFSSGARSEYTMLPQYRDSQGCSGEIAESPALETEAPVHFRSSHWL